VTHDKDLPSIEGSKIFLLSYIRTLKSIKSLSTEEVIKGKCAKFMDTIKPTLTCEPSPGNLRWLMPSPGWVKLNCDGSYKKKDRSAGAGMTLRDDEGKVIFSSCRQLIRCGDPLEAETKACEEGLRLALQWSNCPVSLELDCSVVVEAIKGRTQDRSPLAHLIEEI
jgi:hypothetical protein